MADFKIKYGAAVQLTFTSLASLLGGSGILAGASSAYVDNGSAGVLYHDVLIGGKFVWNGTTPSAASPFTIEVLGFAGYNDTPTFPDAGGALGTDAARTWVSTNLKYNATQQLAVLGFDAVASRVYYMKPTSLRRAFGSLPRYWGIWVGHGATTASSGLASSGNELYYIPVYAQSV